MGSPSRLAAEAFMTLCNSLAPPEVWLRVWNSPALEYSMLLLLMSVGIAIYLYNMEIGTGQDRIQRASQGPQLAAGGQREASQDKALESPPETPFRTYAQDPFSGSGPVQEQLEVASKDSWDSCSINHETLTPGSPSSMSSYNDLTRAKTTPERPNLIRAGSSEQGPLVHIFCTHVEQKLSKNGLVSSITRPSFHVPVAHFPQLQSTFAANSERAFFNSQQEVSASPIVRDPRWLDVQYRLSSPNNPQQPGEVSFDEIMRTIRANRKANRDTTVYVHVVRVKDIVPSVFLTYSYHGPRPKSPTNAMSLYCGEEVPQCTKIVGFRPHLVRVKHLSATTLLWDCARHIVKSLKLDHGIVLQAKDMAIEILGQDRGISSASAGSSLRPFRMDSSETIATWVQDFLPALLEKNGNIVPLEVWAYKKV